MDALVIGYGNIDRQDDGVAWHVLREVAARLKLNFPDTPYECSELSAPGVDLMYCLQLTPEMADAFSAYQKVCFIDAHTGSVEGEIHVEMLSGIYQNSPLTHHLTPSSSLAIAHALFGKAPEALLVSVRGYEFGFNQSLSDRTAALVPSAADKIMEWLAR
jgi:hydrogenase maturation protease